MVLNYRNVDVRFDDRLPVDKSLLDMVRSYIDERFLRTVMVCRGRRKRRFLRFALPEELSVPIPFATSTKVPLDDCVGTIICLDGCILTGAELQDARQFFWYEPVYVEMAPDGTAWIDD